VGNVARARGAPSRYAIVTAREGRCRLSFANHGHNPAVSHPPLDQHDGPSIDAPQVDDDLSQASRSVTSRVTARAAAQVPGEPWPPLATLRTLPGALRRTWLDVLADLGHRIGATLQGTGVRRLAFPVALAVASRLYSSLLLSLVPILQPESVIPRLSGYRSAFLQWDSQWYMAIANTGYHAAPMQDGPFGGRHDFAFFPAWPTILRAFRNLGIQVADVAAPLANVLFVIAAVLIFIVLARHFGETAGRWGVVLLAFSPPAFVLSLAYSEPLFLLLVAASFATRDRRLQPILGAAAMLTRVTGIGLGVAAGLRWLRDRRDGWSFLTAAAVAAAFAGWWSVIWVLTGNPLGWFEGSAEWASNLGLTGIAQALTDLWTPRLWDLAFVAAMLGASIVVLRRNVELGIFSIVAIGMSIVGAPVDSMPRHALVAFPAFGLIAERLGPRRSLLLALFFAALQWNYVWLSFVTWRPLAP
jgi:hypothetical protein